MSRSCRIRGGSGAARCRDTRQVDPAGINIAAIAIGTYDTYLRAYARAVRSYGRQIILSFGHEMNASWYSWGFTRTSAATFVAAWRHIVTVFRAAGARNITWLWTVNVTGSSRAAGIAPWWPGSNYVTWVGIDGYFYGMSQTFESLFGPTITAVRTLTSAPCSSPRQVPHLLRANQRRLPASSQGSMLTDSSGSCGLTLIRIRTGVSVTILPQWPLFARAMLRTRNDNGHDCLGHSAPSEPPMWRRLSPSLAPSHAPGLQDHLMRRDLSVLEPSTTVCDGPGGRSRPITRRSADAPVRRGPLRHGARSPVESLYSTLNRQRYPWRPGAMRWTGSRRPIGLTWSTGDNAGQIRSPPCRPLPLPPWRRRSYSSRWTPGSCTQRRSRRRSRLKKSRISCTYADRLRLSLPYAMFPHSGTDSSLPCAFANFSQ